MLITLAVTVHGAGLADPFSNPGLPSSCVVVVPVVTVKATVAVWVTPPPLPVMVRVAVPAVAVLLAVRVSVELPVPGAAMDAGLKLAVTPVGKPDAESDIADANPFSAAVDTLTVPDVACLTDKLAGVELKLKSAAAAAVTDLSLIHI